MRNTQSMSKMICSICGNAFEMELSPNMPFCSKRCQEIDLGRWLGEEYRMPVDGSEEREFDEEGSSFSSQEELDNGNA